MIVNNKLGSEMKAEGTKNAGAIVCFRPPNSNVGDVMEIDDSGNMQDMSETCTQKDTIFKPEGEK